MSKGEAKKFGWKFLVTKRAHNVVFWKDANLVLSFLLMWTGFNDKWYGKRSLWAPCALCVMCWSESIAYRCSLIRTFRPCQINLVVCACFLKAKSTFPLLAIIKIWFSFFNYKTGYGGQPDKFDSLGGFKGGFSYCKNLKYSNLN